METSACITFLTCACQQGYSGAGPLACSHPKAQCRLILSSSESPAGHQGPMSHGDSGHMTHIPLRVHCSPPGGLLFPLTTTNSQPDQVQTCYLYSGFRSPTPVQHIMREYLSIHLWPMYRFTLHTYHSGIQASSLDNLPSARSLLLLLANKQYNFQILVS